MNVPKLPLFVALVASAIVGCGSSSDSGNNEPTDTGSGAETTADVATDTGPVLPFTPLTKVTAADGCTADGATTSMVLVKPTDATKSFCIDTTEVTVGQYQAFLDATRNGSEVDAQPKACAFNDSYRPATTPTDTSLPMVNVDWCDAYMYCVFAGKHLCGELGGGPVALENIALPDHDAWFFACTEGDPSTHEFPYGKPWAGGKCWDAQPASTQPKDVGTMPDCKGDKAPFDSIFDMSGNVGEWEDACNGADVTSQCHVRGGGAASNGGSSGDSACGTNGTQVRNTHDPLVGFRCCADK